MSALCYIVLHIEIIDELPKLSTEVYRHVVVRSTMYMTAKAVVMTTIGLQFDSYDRLTTYVTIGRLHYCLNN